ncbi:MAG: hypothetical protein ACPG5U_10795 [Planktomarina sp.]
MKKTAISLLTVASLSACAASLPIETAPVNVTYTNAAASKDIVKMATPTVRASKYNADGQSAELSGASCKIQGQGFVATVITPAVVRIPMKAGPPPNLTVTCTDGTLTRTRVVSATNLTKQRIQNSGAGGGLLGALMASAIAAAQDPSNDEYEFQRISVGLNDRPK